MNCAKCGRTDAAEKCYRCDTWICVECMQEYEGYLVCETCFAEYSGLIGSEHEGGPGDEENLL